MKDRIMGVLKNPRKIGVRIMRATSGLWCNDEMYLKLLFYFRMGYRLNLNNPQTFNEKLQWLKLYDKNNLYSKLVDKCLVKEYVTSVIGSEYVIPTIATGWKSAEEIDWSILPSRFVLKTTHGGGNMGVVVCRDKSKLDIPQTINILNSSLKSDLFEISREWCYKNVERQIIAEKYMEDEYGELRDYKFFCFDGKVKALFIASDRANPNEPTKFDFYDKEFNHLNIINGHPMSTLPIERPKNLEGMISIAEKLSEGFPHVRVDLYDVNGKIYFGEFTFYHHSGLCPMEPKEWDFQFGSWLNLPLKNKND